MSVDYFVLLSGDYDDLYILAYIDQWCGVHWVVDCLTDIELARYVIEDYLLDCYPGLRMLSRGSKLCVMYGICQMRKSYAPI